MRPFDENFAENVREAFDGYREPVDENAWNQMKSRLQARSKKRVLVITPLFTRAAAAIVFLMAISGSLWLLLLNPQKPDTSTSYRIHEETAAIPGGGPEHSPAITGRPDRMTGLDAGETGKTQESGETLETGKTSEAGMTYESMVTHETGKILETGKAQETVVTLGTGTQHRPAGPGETSGSPELEDKHYFADVPVIPEDDIMPDTPPVSDIREVPAPPPPARLPPLRAMNLIHSEGLASDLITSEQPAFDADAFIISRNLESVGEMRPGRHRSPAVEVSAGSMKTWSTGEIAGGMGYMAGVGGDWRIGRRFSIHSGGTLVYNRFSLQNTPVSPNLYSSRGRNSYSIPESDFDRLHPGSGMYTGYQVLSYQSETSDIEFTALDIPFNLRFTIKENPRNRIFMSAGFSSILYMQQKYRSESTVLASYHWLNPQGHYESATGYANLISEGDFNAFSRFDPAGLLNLSAGYVIRRRNHALIIEPWLKYPSFDITSFNLFIGMTGLSIKYLPDNR